MSEFSKSRWIWLDRTERPDSYVEFRDSFRYLGGGRVFVRLSCDSDYVLYVNGTYVASGQYGDYEHYKIFDTVDVTAQVTEGENRLDVLAYHCGAPTSRYCPASAGLLYEAVSEQGEILTASRGGVDCRLSPRYESGRCVLVSPQLGFTFFYDAAGESSEGGYLPAQEVGKTCTLYPRPIARSALMPRRPMKTVTRLGETRYLIDLGGETVGLPTLELISPIPQRLTVSWGEHIEDGCVRKRIGSRSFFYEYRAVAGENRFTEYMLRIGCRYLEIESEAPVQLVYAGVIPQVYKTECRPVRIADADDRRIYDVCVNTLRLCMMEHYVDCPWREQALYAFDSRNQMLSGYCAFKGGNAAYARANLLLISHDPREDGLLSICYPSGTPLAIPSFSLYYLIAVWEYTEASGDLSLAREVLPRLFSICRRFLSCRDGGLAELPIGKDKWNFYDWTDTLQGKFGHTDPSPDLVLNALLLLSLRRLRLICEALGEEFPFSEEVRVLREAIRDRFLVDGAFVHRREDGAYTVLGNALAILSGAATEREAKEICRRIAAGDMLESTLSMSVLKYQALLDTDTETYAPTVLSEIRQNYKKMLDAGSDTVWETLDGASAFNLAGSLCHGWSAVPVYIFHRLGIAVADSDENDTN